MLSVHFRSALPALALALGACGGGGSSSPPATGGGGPISTPSPTPTPTPTSTARVFGAAQATGVIDFRDGDLDNTARFFVLGFTARDGRYFPDFENAIAAYRGVGTGNPDVTADYSDTFKEAALVDHDTGFSINLRATGEYTAISPVTTLLAVPGSQQAKVKRQLGITGSAFALINDPDLRSFDPVAAFEAGDDDGARLFAANLRAMLIWMGARHVASPQFFAEPGRAGFEIEDIPVTQPQDQILLLRASRCLNSGADVLVFEEAPMVALLECYVASIDAVGFTRTPIKVRAAAHLINTYAQAIPVAPDTATERARYLLGIEGYLRTAIGQVMTASDDTIATAALQVSVADIRANTAIYSENLGYNATGLYQPSPDFLVLQGDAAVTVSEDKFTLNDVVFSNERFNTRGIDRSTATITGLFFEGDNENDIIVDFNRITASGVPEFTFTARNGFRGVTFFDYEAEAQNGETVRTRVYVRVLD